MSPTQLMQRAIALPLVVVLELVVRAIGAWDDLVDAGGRPVDELTLFESPAELHARLVDEWWTARTCRGRYRCPLCGRSERTQFAYMLNHTFAPAGWLLAKGYAGEWCSTRHLATNHALNALRSGDVLEWRETSMQLRKMAAALRGWPW